MSKTVAELVTEARAQVKSLTPQEAFDEATSGRAVLLDVREPVEWEHHIDGALQIPGVPRVRRRPHESAAQRGLDPTGRVIVYCRSGLGPCWPRSRSDMGYTNVANLEGGISAWQGPAFPPLNITMVSERKENRRIRDANDNPRKDSQTRSR